MTAPVQTRADLWRRYESSILLGGSDEERRWAFDQWWKLEKADAFQSYTNEQRDLKRKQGKAAHA